MNIAVRTQNVSLTPALDKFTKDSIRAALSRSEAEIISVDVYLKDINGPKGGVDKECIIRVNLRDRRRVTVRTSRADIRAAIGCGVKRARRAVRRQVRRARYFENSDFGGAARNV